MAIGVPVPRNLMRAVIQIPSSSTQNGMEVVGCFVQCKASGALLDPESVWVWPGLYLHGSTHHFDSKSFPLKCLRVSLENSPGGNLRGG